MRTFLMICVFVATSAFAGEKPDPGRYPITGLTSMDLSHLLEVANTNLPNEAAVSCVLVEKDSVSVRTIVSRNGETILGDDVVLKAEGNKWKVSEKRESQHRTVKAGLPMSAMLSLVRAIAIGPRLLSIVVESDRKATVDTGHVYGSLSGSGMRFIFEKIGGKWKKTKEEQWFS